MKRLVSIGLFLLLAGLGGILPAQAGKGDRLAEKLAFEKASLAYENSLKKNSDPVVWGKLGDVYWNLGQRQKAGKAYGKSLAGGERRARIAWRYSHYLRSIGEEDSAAVWMGRYARWMGRPDLARKYAASVEFSGEIRSDTLSFEVKPADFNSSYSEIGPVFYKQGLIFASNRPHGDLVKATTTYTNTPFYDLFYVRKLANGNFETLEFPPGKLNSTYHDGPVSFTPAEQIAFVTRSQNSKDRNRIGQMQLLESRMVANRWEKAEPLPFNDPAYSVVHAAIGAGEERLIFSSDMPGGFGGKDLYQVWRQDSGWTLPHNLGPEVNTEGDELFPALHPDGTLFFASNGLPGVGGLDLFMASPVGQDFGRVRNLGTPLNSPFDDFSLTWSPLGTEGYFSSNRPGGAGGDDIWYFFRKKYLNGQVVIDETEMLATGLPVYILLETGDTAWYFTDGAGRFFHPVTYGKDYQVEVITPDYEPVRIRVSTRDFGISEDIEAEFRLKSPGADASAMFASATTTLPDELRETLVPVREPSPPSTEPDSEPDESEEEPIVDYFPDLKEELPPPEKEKTMPTLTNPTRLSEGNALSIGGEAGLWVEGKVLDAAGNPVSKATVVATEWWGQSEASRVQTDSDGRYGFMLPLKKAWAITVIADNSLSERLQVKSRNWGVPDSLNRNIRLQPVSNSESVQILNFSDGRTWLGLMNQKDLNEVAEFLRRNSQVRIELTGFGISGEGNKGRERAIAAQNYLTEQGISVDRILLGNPGTGSQTVEVRILR